MTVPMQPVQNDGRALCDLSQEELIMELRLCHEMFRRCLALLNGTKIIENGMEVPNTPVELFTCSELGDSDDLELYYKCLAIHDTREFE